MRRFASFLLLPLLAGPALATGSIGCEGAGGDDVSVELTVGSLPVLAIVGASIRVGDDLWSMGEVAADRMARHGGGAVVLIGSSAGFASLPDQIAYGAAKAALHHFARGAASEVGHRGVRVNAIAPGYVRTERMLARFAAGQWSEVELGTPLQRAGTTADIAGIALFLVQDVSSYLNGQVILADGGMLNPPRIMRASSERQIAGRPRND